MEQLSQLLTPISAIEARPTLAQVTTIYTDLDGTLFAPGGCLLRTHDGTPSAALAEALVAIQHAGIRIIIVTGRNGTQGHEILRILGLNDFIGEIGTLVIEGTGARSRKHYNLGAWNGVILGANLAPGELPVGVTPHELIRKSGVIERLLAAFPGKLENFGGGIGGESDVTHLLRGNIDVRKASALLADELLPLELVDNGIIHPEKHGLRDCDEIHVYHLLPAGCSKASAVANDIKARGLKTEETIAIGDSPSDLEMGVHTGSLVVVANALDAVDVRLALKQRSLEQGEGIPSGASSDGAFFSASDGALANASDGAPEARSEERPTFITEGRTADGWVEFAQALLAARIC